MKLKLIIVLVFFTLQFSNLMVINGQSKLSIQCGDIIEGELLPGQPNELVFNEFVLAVSAGTKIDLIVEPLGQNFNVGFVIRDSAGTQLEVHNHTPAGIVEEIMEFSLGGSNQIVGIYGLKPTYFTDSTQANFYNTGGGYAGTFLGAYQISLACTLRDGTRIEFGESAPEPGPGGSPSVLFSGFGFPGLAPVDFNNGVTIPLTADIPNSGSISTGFEGIFGYSFNADAGQAMSLDFVRLVGNLNLGVVLLSADNQVAFQASLVTSNTLSTDLVIPVSGDYTLGVFRIDLIPPSAPENTSFTVTASLN